MIFNSNLNLFGFIASLTALYVFAVFAKKINLLDIPDHRKLHGEPIPLVGGLAIYLVLGVFGYLYASENIVWLLLSGMILVVVGSIDDMRPLGVYVRLISQFVATTAMMFLSNLKISDLGGLPLSFDGITSVETVFTILTVIGLVNSFNMIDGLDGLSAGLAIVACILLSGTMYSIHGAIHQSSWLLYFVSCLLAFWLVNMRIIPLPKVFLGDAGSLLLGFILAWTFIYYTQPPIALIEPVVVIWMVAIPVADTLVVMLRRYLNDRPIFGSDRLHIHFLLVDFGMRPHGVLLTLLITSIVLGTSGIGLAYVASPAWSLFAFILYVACYWLFSSRIAVAAIRRSTPINK